MQPSLASNSENYPPRSWRKILLLSGIGAVTIATSMGGYALAQWFGNGEARTSLQFATMLQQQGDFQGCVDQARLVSSGSSLYDRADDILQSCQLSQANALAQQNNLSAAVRLLGEIPSVNPLNVNVQNALDDWSRMLIDRASAQYDMGKREDAIAILRTIPETSAAHEEAATQIDQWNKDWTENAARVQKIQQVLQVNDLKSAFAELQQITTLYWTQQAHDIILNKITSIIAYEKSVAAANAEKLAIAQQLQAEAERRLHEAQAKAKQHYAKSHAHPKPHVWHPPQYWIPVPWRRAWVPPIVIRLPHPPIFPPHDGHPPDRPAPPHGNPGTGPIGDEPGTTEPPITDPGTPDPGTSDPVITDPAPPDPGATDPVVTDPVVTDPIVTDPIVTDPIVTDPSPTDPVGTDPVVTDPVITDPVVTDPAPTDPVVVDPIITDPIVSDPVPPDPVVVDPVVRSRDYRSRDYRSCGG